jgi:hypothetical protein
MGLSLLIIESVLVHEEAIFFNFIHAINLEA